MTYACLLNFVYLKKKLQKKTDKLSMGSKLWTNKDVQTDTQFTIQIAGLTTKREEVLILNNDNSLIKEIKLSVQSFIVDL